jgi:hypothetical protein
MFPESTTTTTAAAITLPEEKFGFALYYGTPKHYSIHHSSAFPKLWSAAGYVLVVLLD